MTEKKSGIGGLSVSSSEPESSAFPGGRSFSLITRTTAGEPCIISGSSTSVPGGFRYQWATVLRR